MKIENQIEKQLNIIVDRYERRNIPIKDFNKTVIRDINSILKELSYIEALYLKKDNKDDRDFKKLVKDILLMVLRDRKYSRLDKGEKVNENFEDFEETWIQEGNKFQIGDLVRKGYEYVHYYAKPNSVMYGKIGSVEKHFDYYDVKYWRTAQLHILGRFDYYKVSNIGFYGDIDLITIEGHWPWFKADDFELVYKSHHESFDFEEVWEEDFSERYKIVKYQSFYYGKRFYLIKVDNLENEFEEKISIVNNFKTMEERFIDWGTDLENVNKYDIEDLKSGKYVISNGYGNSSQFFKGITYSELLEKGINIEL